MATNSIAISATPVSSGDDSKLAFQPHGHGFNDILPAFSKQTVLSLAKRLAGANAFEISDIQEDESEAAPVRRSDVTGV
jgi:hypothetical protein